MGVSLDTHFSFARTTFSPYISVTLFGTTMLIRRITVLLIPGCLLFFHGRAQTGVSPNVRRYIDSSEVHRPDSSHTFYFAQLALDMAGKTGRHSDLGTARVNLAKCYTAFENRRKAINCYDEAIGHFKKAGALAEIPDLLRISGRIHYEFADYGEAMRRYLRAMELFDSLHIEDVNKAWTLRYIGSVYKREKNYNSALHYYRQAYTIFEKAGDLDGMASSLNNIGIVHQEQGSDSLGMHYYTRALDLCIEGRNFSRAAVISDNIGLHYLETGDFQTAIAYFNHAQNFLRRESPVDKTSLGMNLANMAEAYIDLGEYIKAKSLLDQAYNLATKTEKKQKLLLRDIYGGYARMFKKQGAFELALHYRELFDAMNDTLEDLHLASEIEQISFRNDREKIEQIREAEKQLEAERYEAQQEWIILLMIALIAALIFGGVILLQILRLSKSHRILAERNLEVVQQEQKAVATATIEAEPDDEADTAKYSASALSPEQRDALFDAILQSMENDKVFLDPEMSVVKLAGILHTNKSYISQTVNEKVGKNFSMFINEYRIKEARKMLANKAFDHLTIEAIAHNTGFKSISAFNNSFKRFTGITPSYFLKSIREKNERHGKASVQE